MLRPDIIIWKFGNLGWDFIKETFFKVVFTCIICPDLFSFFFTSGLSVGLPLKLLNGHELEIIIDNNAYLKIVDAFVIW